MKRNNIVGSIGQSLFYACISLFSLGLAFWQYQRAIREELKRSSLSISQERLIVGRSWIYERPDRSEGLYYEVIDSDQKATFLVRQEDFESSSAFRITKESLPSWIDHCALQSTMNGQVYANIHDLMRQLSLEKNREKVGVLRPQWQERDLTLKRHRHYGYAIQWLGLACASLWYMRRSLLQRSKAL